MTKHQHFCPGSWLLGAIIALTLCLLSSPALAQRVVGVGLGGYFEDGAITGEEQIGPSEPTDESYEYRNDTLLNGALWVLFDIGNNLRAGAVLRYYGGYAVNEVQEEEDNNDDEDPPPAIELGRLLEIGSVLEWKLAITEEIRFILGLSTGIALLFPRGNLQEEIDRLQAQEVGVFGGPRFGYYIGPQLSLTYQLLERLGLRLDFGVRWEEIFLFWRSDEISRVAFSKEWDAEIVRYELTLGTEISF